LKFKISIKKIRKLFTKKSEIDEISNLYKEIGL